MAAARRPQPPLHLLRAQPLLLACLLFAHDLRPLRATQMQTTHADYPPFSLSCFKAQCGGSGRGSGSLLLAAASASARSSSVTAGSAAAAAADDAEWAGWRVQPLSIDLVSSAGEYLSGCLSAATDSSGKGRDSRGGGLLRRLQDDIAAYFNDRCLAVASAGSSPMPQPSAGAGDGDLSDDDRNLDPFSIDSNAIESAARGGGCLTAYDSLAAVSVRYRCERRQRDSGGGNVTTAAAAASASPPTQQPSTLASQAGRFSGSHRQSDVGADDAAADSENGERTVMIAGSSTAAADAAALTVDEPSAPGFVVAAAAAPEATAASASLSDAAAAEVIAAGGDRNGSAPFLMMPGTPQLTALLDGLATADVVAAAAVPAALFFVVIAVVVVTAIVCWKRRLILVVRFSSHPSSPPSSTVIAAVAAPDAGPAEADAPPHYVAAERVCSTSLPVVGPARSSSSTGRQRRLSEGSGVSWCCCFPRRTCLGACERRTDAAAAAVATATAVGCDGRSAPRRAAGDGNSYAEIEYDGDDDVATASSSTYDDPELGRSGRSAAARGSGAFASSEHLYHTPMDCAAPDEAVLGYCAAATAASLHADGSGCCRHGGCHLPTQHASSSPTLLHEQRGDSNSGGGGDGLVHVSHSDASLSAAVCRRRTDEQRQSHLEEVQFRPPDALPVMESLSPQRGDTVPQHRSAASAFAWRPPPPALPPPPPPPRPSSFANVSESCYFTLESDFR